MKKVAIVYDRVNKWGGAERVLLALHEIFPDAPLYTSVYDKKGAPWAKVFDVRTSFLQKLPFAKVNHELLPVLMPIAFESFDFSDFDVVISVTSEAAKGVKTGPKTLHICYCLTPTRYLWSHYDQYLKGALKFFAKPIIKYLRKWDMLASHRPDIMVGISTEVAGRIKKYYKRDSVTIFPPGEVESSEGRPKTLNGKYYLLVSRLDYGYKKVDLAIKAFNKLGYPLVIVGTGRLEKRLKKIAKKNIKFAGKVSEKDLKKHYLNAKALIMPQEEDFGIVAVEAQALGVPVIAYGKGGALDTVIPAKTGIFFDRQEADSLLAAVKRFEKMEFDQKEIIKSAQRFSKDRFQKGILALINKYARI